MGKIAKGVNETYFTVLYGNYCYIYIENFPQEFSLCMVARGFSFGASKINIRSTNKFGTFFVRFKNLI